MPSRFYPLLIALLIPGVSPAQPPLPQYDEKAHLGAQTCAASTCHGAVKPWQTSAVLQNEYLTWKEHDAHAGAYETLFSKRSRRIAGNLGIGPAHKADLCLNCHADNVPAAQREKNFRIEDGVSCEACHGGAQDWLGQHVSGTGTHSDNLAAGMYPTDQPAARTRLCLSCHYGSENKFLNHRIMGAGHPRTSFELDTFTVSQPAHFVTDDDYGKRKRKASPMQTWAIGQAVSAETQMEVLLDPKRNHDGIFPELVLFDCFACHHSMSDLRWQPRASTGLAPGTPRLNDGNLVMLRVIATLLDPALGKQIRRQTRALHQASQQGRSATMKAARNLRDSARQLTARLDQQQFADGRLLEAMRLLIAEGRMGEYSSYVTAEQAVMAIATLMDHAETSGVLAGARAASARKALEQAYNATAKDEAYRPTQLTRALDKLALALK